MYKTKGLKNSRIEVADALRGLAVAPGGLVAPPHLDRLKITLWQTFHIFVQTKNLSKK